MSPSTRKMLIAAPDRCAKSKSIVPLALRAGRSHSLADARSCTLLLEHEELAEHVVLARAGERHADLLDHAQRSAVPRERRRADGADLGLRQRPLHARQRRLGGEAAPLRLHLDAVADLGDAVLLGAAVEDDAADDARLRRRQPAYHQPITPQAAVGVVAN